MAEDIEEIYKNYAKSVYRYLLSLTHDEDLAEELTEETFYRAVYSIHTYNGSCKVSVWLCQIAKHVWYQELGKRKRHPNQELHEDIPSPNMSPEEASLFQSNKMDLYRAIHQLNEPMREIVYICVYPVNFPLQKSVKYLAKVKTGHVSHSTEQNKKLWRCYK